MMVVEKLPDVIARIAKLAWREFIKKNPTGVIDAAKSENTKALVRQMKAEIAKECGVGAPPPIGSDSFVVPEYPDFLVGSSSTSANAGSELPAPDSVLARVGDALATHDRAACFAVGVALGLLIGYILWKGGNGGESSDDE